MALIACGLCCLLSGAALVADLVSPSFRRGRRQSRYFRLFEASVMVVATGGILSYLNGRNQPGSHVLHAIAFALQAAGYIGAAFFSIRSRSLARKRTRAWVDGPR